MFLAWTDVDGQIDGGKAKGQTGGGGERKWQRDEIAAVGVASEKQQSHMVLRKTAALLQNQVPTRRVLLNADKDSWRSSGHPRSYFAPDIA